ncbi:MAG: hypothetical protein ACXWTS_03570 [Methylococcaceae bacterium]
MSSFETDVMEDLYYDEAEGPAHRHRFDEYDEFGEDEGDEFLRNVIGSAGTNRYDEYDEYDEYETDEYTDTDVLDAMEDAVVDALEAEDSDEFFRRLRRGIRTVARGVARVAPVASRVASLIPHPAAQAIARGAAVAGRVGRALSADEFEMMEDMFDLADDEYMLDAAAPVMAGLALRQSMPNISQLPRPARQQLVHSVTQATRTVAARQGGQAARAVPAVVRTVQTAVRQRRIQPQATAQAITRTAARIARSPQLTRQMVARARAISARRLGRTGGIRAGGRFGGICAACRRRMARGIA